MTDIWAVKNGVLTLSRDGEERVFDAEKIYSALIDGSASTDVDPLLLSKQLPELRFSKVSSSAFGYFWFDDPNIRFELRVTRRGHTTSVPLSPAIPNHLVLGNTWFYLRNISTELARLLNEYGPDENGVLSLGRYLHLIKAFQERRIIEFVDEAGSALSNRHFSDEAVSAPLNATLYEYQKDGFRWMEYITSENCGCILGDEMGLGKTLQIIALLAERCSQTDHHFLIVAPVTLLENWKREFSKFAPTVDTLIHHGSKRTGRYKDLLVPDVVIISYGTAVSDVAMLNMIKWDIVVLDEAQNIKTPDAARTKAVKRLNRKIGIAVTGTPFENHMTDLWSILDFIAPGFMGTEAEFSAIFDDDSDSAVSIEPILTPLMIRRRVSEVAQDLPERIDIPVVLRMDDREALLYDDQRQKILNDLAGKRATLVALQKLRMYCTHPSLVDDAFSLSDPVKVSSKYSHLCEILEEIIEQRDKAILFTSYTKMFEILRTDIPDRFGIPVLEINGETTVSDRQPIVDQFSAFSGPALLVLNPRAAGTGLNITAANYVIHYNLEWNPALEDQASARAYRRGQKKTVFVYRLYYADTVEQIVNERIEMKRDISELAVVGTKGTHENRDDIMAALMLSPKEENR